MSNLKIYRNAIENESYTQDAIVNEETNTAICYFTDNEEKEKYLKMMVVAPDLLKELIKINNISEDKGIKGCTYGDTDFDSESAAYGFNCALEYVKKGLEEIIKKATT